MGYFTSLKQKIGFTKKQNFDKESESFLALTLTPETVIACTWQFLNEKVEASGVSQKHYSNTQNLVHEAAVAIDKAVEAAASDVEKVVFGLSSNWFEGDNLKSESTKLLNSLSRDLDLSAQAYVSLATAINHFIKIEEGVTPNAVLIGIFENFCEAHLLENNKILSTEKINTKAEVGVIVDLIKKLKDKYEKLPSRIIIFGKPSESLNSRLGSRNWQDIFMHEPKIELLDEKELAVSVAYAQAVDILGYDLDRSGATKPIESRQEKASIERRPQSLSSANNLGFIAGEDILLTQPPSAEATQNTPLSETDMVPNNNNYSDLENIQKPEKEDYAVDLESNISEPDFSPNAAAPHGVKSKKSKLKIPNPLALFKFFKFRPNLKSVGIAAVLIVVLIVIGVYAAGQTLVNAQVVIKVNAKPQESDFKSQVASGLSNIPAGQLPAEIVKGTSEGNQNLVATGTKKTGTKAKGQVKILNWDKSSSKTFKGGTEVISKDGLKFTLDSDIEVASRSATTPGENKVAATAYDIGPKYNINSGTDLTIVGFDEVFYSGVADTAFSGGDEKQVTVASQDDLKRLEKSLNDTLVDKARADLSARSNGRKIYDEAITVKVVKKEFDKKAEEEASLIKLTMSIEVSALTFDENDLKTYLAKITQEKAEQNLESRMENIEILNLTVKSQKDTLALTGRYRANLTPKIDENSLKDKIAGLSTKKAREAIKSSAEISDVQIIITPSIPFIDSLPSNKSKISFKVETN